MTFIIVTLLKILSIVILVLLAVAYFTIAERKIMGAIQRRRGPNVVGYIGLLQPLADGLKLFVKETTIPSNANKGIFLLAPALTFILSLMGWAVIPLDEGVFIANPNLGALFVLAISALNVYSILFAGWSSNSKYAFLGALRSAAQMISYEIPIGFVVLNVAVFAGSFNLSEIVLSQQRMWYVLPLLPVFIVFCVSILAETNRHPFDLPEAEAELVSGYNVEYSAMPFALFFLAEYSNMLLMSAFTATLFLGGWLSPFGDFSFYETDDQVPNQYIPGAIWLCLKMLLIVIFFIVTRATLPRYRYDQLMYIGWKCFIPLTLGYLIFTVGVLFSFDWLPGAEGTCTIVHA
jgi:NADH-quinone oxidoreductase subunit H